MKRTILCLTAEGFGRSPLNLGRADENIAVRVEIDLSRILAQEPTATAHINVQNPLGTEYAAVTSMDGTKLIWDITKADNTVEGTGYAQLTVKGPNDEVLKSAVAMTRIGHSIRGEGLAPDPVQNWVDDAANKLNSVAQAGEEAAKAASNANTAAGNAQTIANTVQAKLDNGDFVGPAGKDGAPGKDGEQGPQGEPGSDASVTADNIQAALGYAPVKDVQVAGSSVLDGGVAKVPIAQSDVPGVVKTPPPQDSGIWNDHGSLKISYATDAEISSRLGNRKTIVCANLDYAVKAAMCDGKGAAWTDAEQQAARERMGADGDYVLIESLILTEAVTTFERNSEPDGTPYNLNALKVIVKFIQGQTSGGFYFYGFNGSGKYIVSGASGVIQMPSAGSASSYRSTAVADVKPLFGLYDCTISQGYQGNAMSVTRAANGAYQLSSTESKIAKFNFYLYNTEIISGTEISIYGVRA